MSGLYETRHTKMHIIRQMFVISGDTFALFRKYERSDNKIKGVAIMYSRTVLILALSALSDKPSAVVARANAYVIKFESPSPNTF